MIAFTMLVVTMDPLIFKTSLISVIEAYVGTYPTSMMDARVVNYFRKTNPSSLFDGVLKTSFFDPDVGFPANIHLFKINTSTKNRCEYVQT